MPRNEDPKGGLAGYYRRSKFPRLKGPTSRMRPVKPIELDPSPFVFKRRKIRLPLDFTAYQESRAVPRSKVYGTLSERIVYKEFRRRRLDFDFQTSLLGGRQQLGGKVADYILWLPYGPVIVRCQSYAFHGGVAPRRKDEEDKRILETLKDQYTGKYYVVYDLWEDVIFDPERLAEWIDRNLLGNYQGQALRAPWAEVEWMPSIEEWNEALAQIQNLIAWSEGLQEQMNHLTTLLISGEVGADFVIDTLNIRNLAVTDAKINDLDVGKLTAGNIDAAFDIAAGGSITAGAGAVTLDASGITLEEGTGTTSKVKWDYDGTTFAYVVADRASGDDDRTLYVWCDPGTANALVRLNAGLNGLEDPWVGIDIDLDDGILLDAREGRNNTDIKLFGKTTLGTPTELTLDTNGAITVTQSNHIIDTFENAATDDLVTISGGAEGMILFLRTADNARDITIKHLGDNIYCGADFTLDTIADSAMLRWDGGQGFWLAQSLQDNV